MMAGWYWWWGRSVLVDVLVEASNSILRAVHSAPRATHSGAPTLRRYHTSHVTLHTSRVTFHTSHGTRHTITSVTGMCHVEPGPPSPRPSMNGSVQMLTTCYDAQKWAALAHKSRQAHPKIDLQGKKGSIKGSATETTRSTWLKMRGGHRSFYSQCCALVVAE